VEEVTGRLVTRRRGRTIAELAARWSMSEEKAHEFLAAFERRGYTRRRGAYWYATPKAMRITGFAPEDG
jgi:DNA-binding IclR family transcriptional regulator